MVRISKYRNKKKEKEGEEKREKEGEKKEKEGKKKKKKKGKKKRKKEGKKKRSNGPFYGKHTPLASLFHDASNKIINHIILLFGGHFCLYWHEQIK